MTANDQFQAVFTALREKAYEREKTFEKIHN